MTMIAMLLSGAVAGLIAMPELLGRDHVYAMAVGALLMSASTVVVALNALRLRRLDLHPA